MSEAMGVPVCLCVVKAGGVGGGVVPVFTKVDGSA